MSQVLPAGPARQGNTTLVTSAAWQADVNLTPVVDGAWEQEHSWYDIVMAELHNSS